MLEVRAAQPHEFEEIMRFYYEMIDRMADVEFKPGWQRDIYPTRDFIRESIDRGEMYVGFVDRSLWHPAAPIGAPGRAPEVVMVCAMVINHETAEGYETVDWPVKASPEEVYVIHALGVHPDYQGMGYGKEAVLAAADICREKSSKAIRLDVLGNNLPAQKLYPSVGFQYVTTLKLFYEDTGLTDFLLYELAL